MKQRLCRILAAPVAAAFLNAMLAPAIAVAQSGGFEFGEDEVDSFGEPMDFTDEGWDDETPGDDGWNTDDGWATDEPTNPAVPAGVTTVTGLIVPSPTLDPALAEQLTSALLAQLQTLDGVSVVSNDGLRTEFDIMGAELAYECAFDPVCLGRYGRQLGLTRVVIGRVNEAEDASGQWGTTIDLFETASSSISNYRYFATEPRLIAVIDALPAQVRLLFGIREERNVSGNGRSGPSPAQVAMSWTTAGLALAGVGAGIAFGLKAKSQENDLNDCTVIETADGTPVCTLTQREAATQIDDAKADARLSNILIGGGLFLGVISVVLFSVTPGEDIDESADVAQAPRSWSLAPALHRGGAGLSGAIRF
ncbi:MAG: hypothetical protein H6698_03905 [Myxococcales bacterium]|nr:hypothetical protein [Myxococcales bacterium]MCB9530502.1 hypothetical protein [Myxococcales bacterium]MCB9533454.1 hypothetical protein [Myxococcales bacterium]